MKHYIITSSDGSSTIKLENFDECYHSANGAFVEACHIYIRSGLEYLWNKIRTAPSKSTNNNAVAVFDVGIGTALNCISTLLWQQSLARSNKPAPHIHYIGIEKYPIEIEEAAQLNYPEHIYLKQNLLSPDSTTNEDNPGAFNNREILELFNAIHNAEWDKDVEILKGFTLKKIKGDVAECSSNDFKSTIYPHAPSAIYYDAFSPSTQPELWEKSIFGKIFNGVNTGSVLTTYSSKGSVKQALRDVGFVIERLPGPPGKRHILRATKTDDNH